MRNIRLTIEYDGSRYRGWQSVRKEQQETISGRICEVLRKMTNEEIRLFCGERTETGVHACKQTANFKTDSEMTETEIRQYLNQYLPLDIAVQKAEEVEERFHAELNPHSVTYRYRLLVGDTEDVFQRKYADFRKNFPDIRKLEMASEHLLGEHDFRAFSFGKTKKSTVRKLTRVEVRTEDGSEKSVEILLEANGFLKQMPQRLLGTLLAIGYGERTVECIEKIFEGEEEASAGCAAHALFLEGVDYGSVK